MIIEDKLYFSDVNLQHTIVCIDIMYENNKYIN